MTFLHTKFQGQWSVGSEDRESGNKRTDRRTDGVDCITSLACAVAKNVQLENMHDVESTAAATGHTSLKVHVRGIGLQSFDVLILTIATVIVPCYSC